MFSSKMNQTQPQTESYGCRISYLNNQLQLIDQKFLKQDFSKKNEIKEAVFNQNSASLRQKKRKKQNRPQFLNKTISSLFLESKRQFLNSKEHEISIQKDSSRVTSQLKQDLNKRSSRSNVNCRKINSKKSFDCDNLTQIPIQYLSNVSIVNTSQSVVYNKNQNVLKQSNNDKDRLPSEQKIKNDQKKSPLNGVGIFWRPPSNNCKTNNSWQNVYDQLKMRIQKTDNRSPDYYKLQKMMQMCEQQKHKRSLKIDRKKRLFKHSTIQFEQSFIQKDSILQNFFFPKKKNTLKASTGLKSFFKHNTQCQHQQNLLKTQKLISDQPELLKKDNIQKDQNTLRVGVQKCNRVYQNKKINTVQKSTQKTPKISFTPQLSRSLQRPKTTRYIPHFKYLLAQCLTEQNSIEQVKQNLTVFQNFAEALDQKLVKTKKIMTKTLR